MQLRAAALRRWGPVAVALVALLVACRANDEAPAAAPAPDVETVKVGVGHETFEVELAMDPATRFRGLSGRDVIPRNGGMLFVNPAPGPMSMVMRDCPGPIDVAFADAMGRVVAIHTMQPEPPRRAGESNFDYERRLPEYPSGAPVQFALETAGGRLAEVGLRVGDRLHFPARELVERVRRGG
jgi:uncharacterized membrane protein (UPF0127 family)